MAAVAPDLRTALTWGLDDPAGDDATRLAAFVARAFGASTVAVVHYGSRAQGRQPRADSAFDFFVIVDRYGDAYRSLAATVGTAYSPWIATALAHVLAPNVAAVSNREGIDARSRQVGKCCLLSLEDFERACSPRRRDHFTQGRLFQYVMLAWARDDAAQDAIRNAIATARAQTFAWGKTSLPERFSLDAFLLATLARSLSGEIRPEIGDHAQRLATAQHAALRAIYAPLLTHLVTEGVLGIEAAAGGEETYYQRTKPTSLDRMRITFYFQRSKFRATVRLLKHVVLYEGWLDYIVKKIDRSGDTKIVLTPREQRWPLIFLWPRIFRYLRTRPQRQRERDAD